MHPGTAVRVRRSSERARRRPPGARSPGPVEGVLGEAGEGQRGGAADGLVGRVGVREDAPAAM